jgi:hypothetical protein
MGSLFVDRKSRVARIWSNKELKKFAHLYDGNIVNVSGWKDSDKDGSFYKTYFKKAKSYSITNYKSEAMGFQGTEGEIFLDLTAELPNELEQKFDTVFNHTVLEHIFEVQKAFENLCKMSSDTVILVLPFLQQMHADYGDFWRFTPTCMQKLFEKHGFKVLYSSFNGQLDASVYVFMIASRKPEKWTSVITGQFDADGSVKTYQKPWLEDTFPPLIGFNAVLNVGGHMGYWISKIIRQIKAKQS